MSNKLKYWRNERLLSQIELAAASGLPRWKIQLFEAGILQPTADDRITLSFCLGTPENILFDEAKSRSNNEKGGHNGT